MILSRLGDIAAAVQGRLDDEHADLQVTGLTTDTRRLRSGELFVALDGEHQRGSDFLEEAFRAGAGAAMTARPRPVSGPLVEVEDAHDSLMELGAALRARFERPVVGITGSNGKTTTKDALADDSRRALPRPSRPRQQLQQPGGRAADPLRARRRTPRCSSSRSVRVYRARSRG